MRPLTRTASGAAALQTGRVEMATHYESSGMATALLVIDVQRGLFHRSTPVRHGDQLVATINELADRAHAADVLVVYVQHSSDKVLPFGTEAWQLDQRLHPGPEDLVLHKEHGDAFRGTALADELTVRGVGRLVITGLVTQGCVRATCLGALERGFEVLLVSDGHSSYSRDAEKQALSCNRQLADAGAEVLPAGDVSMVG